MSKNIEKSSVIWDRMLKLADEIEERTSITGKAIMGEEGVEKDAITKHLKLVYRVTYYNFIVASVHEISQAAVEVLQKHCGETFVNRNALVARLNEEISQVSGYTVCCYFDDGDLYIAFNCRPIPYNNEYAVTREFIYVKCPLGDNNKLNFVTDDMVVTDYPTVCYIKDIDGYLKHKQKQLDEIHRLARSLCDAVSDYNHDTVCWSTRDGNNPFLSTIGFNAGCETLRKIEVE